MENLKENRDFPDELNKEIAQHALVKGFSAGSPIFKEGSFIGSAVIVAKGIVKVFRIDENGQSHFLYFLRDGELCVLSALCCMRIRKADMRAVAYTDCLISFIESPYPETWMQAYPEWNTFVLRSFNARMSELLDTFDSVVFKKLDERLLSYLKQHTSVTGNILKLSHKQIADELNSSREVISRLLKKMEDEGMIELNRSFIRINRLD